MSTVNQNNINTTNDHEATLKNGKIGDAADGRRLNGTGTKSSTITSGMNVQTQVPAPQAKDVDSRVIEGSHKSSSDDVSSKFSTDSFKNQAGPRGKTNDTELEGE
jgi:hypothetical protein